jgi:hypothetical protein
MLCGGTFERTATGGVLSKEFDFRKANQGEARVHLGSLTDLDSMFQNDINNYINIFDSSELCTRLSCIKLFCIICVNAYLSNCADSFHILPPLAWDPFSNHKRTLQPGFRL